MLGEVLAPRRNKLGIVVSVVLVAVLTGLGVVTSDTATRQDKIERIVHVQHVRINQALCASEEINSQSCRRHATEIIRACVETPKCLRLLQMMAVGERLPPAALGPLPSNGSNGVVGPGPHRETPPSHKAHHHHAHHHGHPPKHHHHPAPAPAPQAAPPAPPPATPTLPNGAPFPGKGKAKGLLSCVQQLDPNCAVQGVTQQVAGIVGVGD